MVFKMFYDAKQDPSTGCHRKLFMFLRFFFLILGLTVFLESFLKCSQASWAFLSSFRPESSITEAACVSLSVLEVCLSNSR